MAQPGTRLKSRAKRLGVGMRRRLRTWTRNAEGVAAVEFALLAPVISMMFVGAVEMSQAFTADRRAMQISSSVADLVARTATTITTSDMTDIMRIGGYIMLPFSSTPLTITLRNITSSPTSATTTKQSWSCTYNSGGTGSTTCACSSTTFTIPSGLVSTNDSIVVSEVQYNYTPLVFDTILKRAFTKTGSYYTFSKTSYAKPRSQAAILQQANGTPCPSPTFP